MSSKKSSTFLTGAIVGLGLGLLLAPQDGNEAKNKLKSSLNELLNSVKQIDFEETKATFMKHLRQIKDDMNELNVDAKKKIVKEKLKNIKNTCEDLAIVANENNSTKVYDAAKKVEEKATELLSDLDDQAVKKEKKPLKKKQVKRKKVNKQEK